ncbi:DinB family protein [bacterium]|nr:DinB family protein [bacterium]
MFNSTQEFIPAYGYESEITERVLRALTNEALAQSKGEGDQNAADIAWHIATAPRYMFNQIGWDVPPMTEWGTPAGLTVEQIVNEYCANRDRVKAEAAKVSDADLQKVHHVFGMLDWPAWMMLQAQLVHEAHHRGQLSVLMRQAGLTVPSIYGPNKEQTAEMMAQMAAGQN